MNDSEPVDLEPVVEKKDWFNDYFDIDVRSLSLMRILLSVVILFDVVSHFRHLDSFFADNGVVSSQIARNFLGDGFWSLYFLTDSPAGAAILMVLTLIAAFGLLVGFRTRTMTFVCLILLWSLQVRDPFVLNGGHVLIRMLLFWSLFLPLGAVWSVDAWLESYSEPDRWRIRNVASAAIMLQMGFMYFFSGIAKCNEHWTAGTAVEQIMHLDMYIKPMGQWIRQYPLLLRITTWIILAVETIGPILMFTPGIHQFARGAMMAMLLWMHLTIWLTMDAGVFPFVAAIGWLVFVPSNVWESLHMKTGDDPRPKRSWSVLDLIPKLICGAALLYVTVNHLLLSGASADTWNSSWINQIGRTSMATQEYKLFGLPPSFSPDFEYLAKLKDGTEVDIFAAANPKRRDNAGPYRYLADQHWRRIHSNLLSDDATPSETIVELRQRLLEHVIYRWNRSHSVDESVNSAELICTLTYIGPESGEPNQERQKFVEVWAVVDGS